MNRLLQWTGLLLVLLCFAFKSKAQYPAALNQVPFKEKKRGLNYTFATARIGTRFSPAGAGLPYTFSVSGIPATAVVEKAFIWWTASSNNTNNNFSVTKGTTSYARTATLLGAGPDKCWSYTYTTNFRGDVSDIFTSNGSYTLNISQGGNDVDGFGLIVLYSDSTANYVGSMTINDGAIVVLGGSTTHTMNVAVPCTNTTRSEQIFLVGDMQVNYGMSNGTRSKTTAWNWFNFDTLQTSLTAGTNTKTFTVTNYADCFSMVGTAIYYQYPVDSATFTGISKSRLSACNGVANGKAKISFPAGSKYSTVWFTSPTQTGDSAVNLPAGSYGFRITDTCGNQYSDTVLIPEFKSSFTASKANNLCLPDTNILSAGPITGNYQWLKDNSPIPGATANTYSATSSGSYRLIVDDGRCRDTAAALSLSFVPAVIYVDSAAGSSGTGISWASPLNSLSKALTLAHLVSCPVQIWVKKGTYFPHSSNRDSSFVIRRNNIRIYGGFAGTETTLAARNVTANPTILSGNIGAAGVATDNSLHVVTVITYPGNIDSNTVLDGLTIADGQADGGGASPTVFAGYYIVSTWGGALYLFCNGAGYSCSPVINNCTFTHNHASSNGGALSSDGADAVLKPVFSNCTFSNNTAFNGAAASNSNATVRFSDCRFSNNTSTAAGGAIYHETDKPLQLYRNLFELNRAATGGALRLISGNTVLVARDNIFDRNKASGNDGGALSLVNASGQDTLINNVFLRNTASGSAGNGGGALVQEGGNSCYIVNNTFYADSAASNAGAIYFKNGGTNRYVQNNIFYKSFNGTTATDIAYASGTVASAESYNLYSNTNPLFVNENLPAGTDGAWRTADDGLQLKPCSPAVDSGLNTAISMISSDITGAARIQFTTVDKGAYEATSNSLPAAPAATSPVTYCRYATATALTATATSASDTLKWYNAVPAILASAPVPATNDTGTFTFYVSQKNAAGCESQKVPVNVRINQRADTPLAASPVIYCQNATAVPLTATKGAASDTLKWFDASSVLLTAAPTPATATPGSTTYYVSANNGLGCESPKRTIIVTVNPAPAAPATTSTITYCQNSTATALTATKTNPADTLKWYDATPALLTGAPTPGTATPGTTTYYVSEKNSFGCESPKTSITVTITNITDTPKSSSPVIYCQNATAVPLSAIKGAATDTLKWYNASMTLLSGAPTPATASPGTTTYYVSGNNGVGCESPKRAITVIVNPTPLTPASASPLIYCQNSTATALSATKTDPADTLKWYNAVPALLSAAPTPVTSTPGTTTYYVSEKNSFGCESPAKAITVTVNAITDTPKSSSPVIYCQNATAVPLTATKGAATDTLKWYNASMTLLSGAPTPATTSPGTTTYYVSGNNDAGCESPKRAITVTVNPTPLTPASTSPVIYCQNSTVTALSATKTNPADTLKWYDAVLAALSGAPTPLSTTPGTTTYYVSEKNSFGCESPKKTITVTINPTPAMPASTSPVIYCQNATASALTATKNDAADTLKWYNAVPALLSGAPTPLTATPGNTTYYVSEKNNSGCESPKRTITVTVNPTPATPASSSPVVYCQGATAGALTATAGIPGTDTLKWYNATPALLSGAPTPSTATAGTTTYYVSGRNSFGCESPKKTITVTVNPTPAAPAAASPVIYCQEDIAVALSATKASGVDTLKWYDAAPALLGAAPVPATTTAGSTTYYVSGKTSLGCEGPRTTITVTVNPKPAAPAIVTPIDICIGIIPEPLTASGTNLKWYNSASGGTAASSMTPAYSSTGTTTYYVSQTTPLGCESNRAALSVNVRPSPVVTLAPFAAPAFVFCVGDSIKVAAISSTATSYSWYRDRILIGAAHSDTLSIKHTADYMVIVKDIYGCADTAMERVIENPLPPPTLSPTNVSICAGISIVLYVNPGASGYNYAWLRNDIPMGIPGTESHTPVSSAGVYSVRVTDIYNCVLTTNKSSVNLYPALPVPVIEQLDRVLRTTTSYSSYQWYRNGKLIPGATGRSYTMSFDGDYHVVVTDINGCIASSETIRIEKLGIETQPGLSDIRLYPNPTSAMVTIAADFPVHVRVTDVTGRLILDLRQTNTVDLSNYADGVYIFSITDTENIPVLTEKISKHSN